MTAHKPVKKAVIPVAGYGTRFLPYTKSIPKEMLAIVDRPVIHHIVEEIATAGITEIILITGMNKRAIEDYFDYNTELEMLLEKNGKISHKQLSREASDLANYVYIRQKEMLGNGHAVYQAKDLIAEDEPFLVVFGDEMFMGAPSKVQQVINAYNTHQAPVMTTLYRDADTDYAKYGYAAVGDDFGDGVRRIAGFSEKPGSREKSPSAFASAGCMVLHGDIFPYIERQAPNKNNEVVLGEALNTYVSDGHTLNACELKNLKYFDCGDKLGYMQATIEFALQREDIGPDFANYIRELAAKL